MELDERLTRVAVLGAGGKMGSGIASLLAAEMAQASLKPENQDKRYRLILVDLNEDALDGLLPYIQSQVLKKAEKAAISLRQLYASHQDLVENSEIINAFVQRALSLIRPSTELAAAKGARMVFEAIVESEDVKVRVFQQLKEICHPDAFFLTNTSSIPIGLLDDQAGLSGRVMGYHFYNPPAVQRLIEMILAQGTREDLGQLGLALAKRLGKVVVPAHDVAGFIGNGHFIRDGLFGVSEATRLSQSMPLVEALYMVNRVTQDWLIRPMGILQLIDYVGVEVFGLILKVMRRHIGDDSLNHELIERMVQAGVLGGQRSDGSQKDGFLRYERNRPVGVYDLDQGRYRDLDARGWSGQCDQTMGALPKGHLPWKALLGAPDLEARLKAYFAALLDEATLGSQLAKAYLSRSRAIAQGLVDSGVADSPKEVNDVLTNGFYHLYGPINDLYAADL